MRFTPRTDQEIADSKLWKKGIYDFEILDGFDKGSKAGNEMIELKIRLSDGNGGSRVLGDYLLEKMPEKLLHASRACGLEEKYKAGAMAAADFRGKRGKLKLAVEKAKGTYPAKNVVADYVCEATTAGSVLLNFPSGNAG